MIVGVVVSSSTVFLDKCYIGSEPVTRDLITGKRLHEQTKLTYMIGALSPQIIINFVKLFLYIYM